MLAVATLAVFPPLILFWHPLVRLSLLRPRAVALQCTSSAASPADASSARSQRTSPSRSSRDRDGRFWTAPRRDTHRQRSQSRCVPLPLIGTGDGRAPCHRAPVRCMKDRNVLVCDTKGVHIFNFIDRVMLASSFPSRFFLFVQGDASHGVAWSHPIDAHYGVAALTGWPQLLVAVWTRDAQQRNEIGWFVNSAHSPASCAYDWIMRHRFAFRCIATELPSVPPAP